MISAHQKRNNSFLGRWEPVTTNEIKTFLVVLLLMGIVYKPKMRMYWSKDALYSTPTFSEVMSHNRFELIMKFFHFKDNSPYNPTNENRDRLHKVQPLIEALHERCQKVYYPGQNFSVDEWLVLFKGRLHFKQLICTKRARFGIKLYELCTSSGITLDFLVFGKGMFSDDDPYHDMLSSKRIPSILIQPFLRKGDTLYTNNYYTSPSLGKFLLENKTHLCGTICSNQQNYSKELVNTQLDEDDAAFFSIRKP